MVEEKVEVSPMVVELIAIPNHVQTKAQGMAKVVEEARGRIGETDASQKRHI